VFVSQARAYRAMGASVHALAMADVPGRTAGSTAARRYLATTPDLVADRRSYAGMPAHRMAGARFLADGWSYLHGNAAAMLVGLAEGTAIPADILGLARVDLVHCNHFFCMPVALKIKAAFGCPILVETHDLQAEQFALRNRAGYRLPPKTSRDEMLALELDQLDRADLLIHLNDEEAQTFERLLPERRHALLYPAIAPVATGPGGGACLIVASANYPNYQGVAWFLEEVLPLVPEARVRIIGDIDQMVRARAPAQFRRHAPLFEGRIDDLDGAYAAAATVLLPTLSGHGLSIKTVEALSSGAPLIATPAAFRGMAVDPATLANVTLVTDAAGFATALRAVSQAPATRRAASPTRQLFDRLFAFEAYATALAGHAAALVPDDSFSI
jgi:glycosyltransferase involved in cell wall biosynthesis